MFGRLCNSYWPLKLWLCVCKFHLLTHSVQPSAHTSTCVVRVQWDGTSNSSGALKVAVQWAYAALSSTKQRQSRCLVEV